VFSGHRAGPLTALAFSAAWGVAPHVPCPRVDTGTAKSSPARETATAAQAKWPFLALALRLCGHSLLPLVCRFQPHNVQSKSVLGPRQARHRRSKQVLASPRPVGR
jgi:hypothetical protein